jgi:hypothetical protein
MKRCTRKLASWFGLIAIVFAQLAVSAYACPGLMLGSAQLARSTEATEAAVPCADFAAPGLCQQHCNYGHENVGNDTASMDSVVLAPAFLSYLAQPPLGIQPAFAANRHLLFASGPPLTIRNCCFRI